jgi:N-methylhydantoinase A
VRLLLSGPAAGVSAASAIAAQAGFPNAISADMGGTSLDVALIRDGSATLTYESEIDEGVPIRSPMTDIKTVGAGGGSLAYVDRQGLLRVGPESAGSTPGPVCYGRGGTRPTITDANLWLGRLDVARIPGVTDHGGVLAAVEIAIRTHVADPLGMSVDEAAVAIITIANHTLAMAIRLVSIERGVDPRDLALIPFGGAASLHAIAWARELSIPTVLVPLRPGVTSALGCLVADIEQELVRSHPVALDALDPGELEAIVEDLAAQGRAVIDEQRIAYERVSTLVTLDLQYEGQFHVFHLDFGELPRSREMIAARFQEAYSEHYGLVLEGMRALLVNVRVHVTAHRPDVDVTSVTRRNGHRRPRRTRSVWTDVGREEVEVIDRMTLADGDAVAGPAVLEQDDTTIYLPAGTHGHVDGAGNLVLDAGRAA